MHNLKLLSIYPLIISLWITSSSTEAHDLTKVNFNYLYNHAPVKIDYQTAKQDSLYKLILSIHLVKVLPSDKLVDFELSQQKKISSIKEEQITPISLKVDSGFIKNVIEIHFQANEESGYLVVKFSFLNKPYLFGIPINESLPFPMSDILYKTDAQAMFYDGFRKNDSVWFENLNGLEQSYYVFRYKENFPPALPPMVEDGIVSNEFLTMETMPLVNRGMTLNGADYLYFIQTDSSTEKGTSILCHKEYYPRNKKVEELIETLIYVCTGEEYEELLASENKKEAFNEFWLDHINGKKLATKAIKKYFRSVKFANALFSDYKNGWKTDRGMIYIAFGPPEEVTKKEKEEIWEYKTYDGNLKFIFAKTPNLFVQQHYTLIRQKAMNKAWFQTVQKWRTGDL